MHRVGIFVDKLFMIVIIIIGIAVVISASDDVEPALSDNFYVLKSCTPSVELSRRKVETRVSTFPHPVARRPVARIAVLAPVEENSSWRGGVKSTRAKTKLRRGFTSKNRPGRGMADDTPLATLNLKRRGPRGRNDEPQLFVRKKHLPEVRSFTSGGDGENKKNEASIILIKSAI